MNCPSCGKQVLSGSKFCANCGASMVVVPTNRSSAKTVEAIALVAALIIGGFVWASSLPKDKPLTWLDVGVPVVLLLILSGLLMGAAALKFLVKK
jgi:uncharacterized protein (DUF983 family)